MYVNETNTDIECASSKLPGQCATNYVLKPSIKFKDKHDHPWSSEYS
jgi:hypothetical protein